MTSNTEKPQGTEQSQVKNTSSRRRQGAKRQEARKSKLPKLPKAKQLKVSKKQLDPIEHCKVTREMVLEDRGRIATLDGSVKWLSNERSSMQSVLTSLNREVCALRQSFKDMKVVRAWPIYTALVVEAALIAWLGAKVLGYA